uniref:Putative UDP-N-acetylglucosamine 2-epimerase n=1 Tax=viral metagenome TaxID=1070528 RepID=A0A6M3K872_9ZZZZ
MICLCVGTRPNFIKAAPLIRELVKQGIPYKLVHTGQHYDRNMSEYFFNDLELPKPDYTLQCDNPNQSTVGRIADIMTKLRGYIVQIKPSIVIVLGDVDSSLACALAANKAGFRVAHVEAGERCDDKTMPEEINRILIDELSDILFFASEQAYDRFLRNDNGHFVGNIMIDQLQYDLKIINGEAWRPASGIYSILTLHRQNNVDNFEKFVKIYQTMLKVSEKIPINFPVHPRTMPQVKKVANIYGVGNILIVPPMSRLDFLALVANAKFVMTDSGGLQVETSYLNVPCLTLREQTEWIDTLRWGSNVLTGIFEDDILKCVNQIIKGDWKQSKIKDEPAYSGHAAERIVEILKREIIKS